MAPKRKYPQLADSGWLRERYEDQGLPVSAIASEVGCSPMAVHRALVQFDIPRRPAGSRGSRYPRLKDADWLRAAYWDEGKSLLDIAQEVGCSETAVAIAFERLGIEKRSTAEGRELRSQRYRGRIDWVAVEARYAAGEGFGVIGRSHDVTGHFIRKVLVERGVEVRSKAEQNRIELARRERQEKMQAKARERRRPTGVRGVKAAIEDGTVCAFCGQDGLLQQHHLNAIRSDDRPGNLVPLCPDCHRKVEWFIGHALRGLGGMKCN